MSVEFGDDEPKIYGYFPGPDESDVSVNCIWSKSISDGIDFLSRI